MNIQALYLEMKEDEFLQSTLSGSFELKGNCIIWSYELYETSNNDNNDYYDDEENDMYNFERQSNEEILLETHRDDVEEIKEFLEDLEDDCSWEFTEPEVLGDTISFKIY